MKKILIKYDLPDINHLLDNPHKKEKWKTHVYRYWQDEIINISNYYRFLTYLNPDIYTPRKIHPLLQIPIISSRESNRIAIKLKVMSGAYVLQSNRANFNKNKVDPTCMICGRYRTFCIKLLLARKCKKTNNSRDNERII